MSTDPNWDFFRTLVSAYAQRIRQTKADRGALSIEMMILVAAIVVVAGVGAAVILSKVNEKKNDIK